MLLADRIQIQQVVTNLILNSTEVMESVEPEMRKLIIELSTAPSTLRLRSVHTRGSSLVSRQLKPAKPAFVLIDSSTSLRFARNDPAPIYGRCLIRTGQATPRKTWG